MKKVLTTIVFLLLLLSSIACPTQSQGQAFTAITATLTDSNGQVWANASYTITIVPPFGNPSKLNNQGFDITSPVVGFANGSGVISTSLDDNSVILPKGSTWQFVICPNATVKNCSTSIQVVHGTSMDLSASLSADLVPVAVAAAPTVYRGYIDSEVTGGQGAIYWRTSDNSLRGFNGTTWVPIGLGGGVLQPLWNNIQAPTGNLTLNMANFSTLFNMGTNTGTTGAAFTITDSSSNTGTNYLWQTFTAAGSTAKPWAVCAGGTNNCIEFNASATMQALGSATLTATQVINTGPGVGIVQLGSNGSGSVSAANTIKLTGNSNKAYISENGGTLSKVLLGGQINAGAGNAVQSIDTAGNVTAVAIPVLTNYGKIFICNTGSNCNSGGFFLNPIIATGITTLSAGSATVTNIGAGFTTIDGCVATDTNSTATVAGAFVVSSTSITLKGTGTDVISWMCFGN